MSDTSLSPSWSPRISKHDLHAPKTARRGAAEGLETAKETYTKALGEQNQLLTGSWISLGLAGVSAIYGGWSYFGAEDASRWERFLIDEAPAKVEGDKPAEAAGTKTP